MKRIIVDYAKLTNEILTLLVEKFPDGYDETDIVRFKNVKNETIEAVEVRTEDTIFLVKVSTKLADRIENYDEDEVIIPIGNIDIDNEEEDDEEEKIEIDSEYDEDEDEDYEDEE